MKKNLKSIFLSFLSSICVGSVVCGTLPLLQVDATASSEIIYKSAQFTENFALMEESDASSFSTENVIVQNGKISKTANGAGVIMENDTIVTTNMGFDEFDLYLTLSDDSTSGDPNMRGPMISFANGNESVYNVYLAGNYASVGTWILKDGVNIAPDWAMMASATTYCKYKIEVREGSVYVKYWSDSSQSYEMHGGFPMYVERSDITNVSGYITIEKCGNTKGTYTLNELTVDPIAEDVPESTTTPDTQSVELGEEGAVSFPVEMSEKRFVGAFVNGRLVDNEYLEISKVNDIITNVSINNEMFAQEYCRDLSITEFDVAIIARDVKFGATLQYTIGNVKATLVDENGKLLEKIDFPVGTLLNNTLDEMDKGYLNYAIPLTRIGFDGRERDYISTCGDTYRIYKDTKVYCLTESYKCNVYLYTQDNFSDWYDAQQVKIPFGMTIVDYIEQINNNDNPNDDITVANPYGKIFVGWDYTDPIVSDIDICAEYYTLKQNGQDVEITFDKQPTAAEMQHVSRFYSDGRVSYDGTAKINRGHPFNALNSSQKYTDFEYSFDILGMNACYTNDWCFAITFGASNRDMAAASSRKYNIMFKNAYDPESKAFSSQLLVQEGGDNVTANSSHIVAIVGTTTKLFTSKAAITGEAANEMLSVYPHNSGLNAQQYVTIKIRVVDGYLTVYMKSSLNNEFVEEYSTQLTGDTSGYITYFQNNSDFVNGDTEFVIDNIKLVNLMNEQHEIVVTKDDEAYSSPEEALLHTIGENEEGNDIPFYYNSRYQAFVGTTYIVYDEDWDEVARGARDISVERMQGQTLTRTITFSDNVLAQIYDEYASYVYGANKTLNVKIEVLTESDYAEIYLMLCTKSSYRIFVKKDVASEEKDAAGAGAFGETIDLYTLTSYFSDYCKAEDGYIFTGWKDCYEGTTYGDSEKVSIYKNMTLVPNFERKSYTVKFVDEEGTVYDEKTVLHGDDSVLPTFIPESDKGKFVKWADDYKAVTSDRSVLAIFDDSGNDSPVEESGCKSSINTGMIALTLAFVATFVFSKKKKMI